MISLLFFLNYYYFCNYNLLFLLFLIFESFISLYICTFFYQFSFYIILYYIFFIFYIIKNLYSVLAYKQLQTLSLKILFFSTCD